MDPGVLALLDGPAVASETKARKTVLQRTHSFITGFINRKGQRQQFGPRLVLDAIARNVSNQPGQPAGILLSNLTACPSQEDNETEVVLRGRCVDFRAGTNPSQSQCNVPLCAGSSESPLGCQVTNGCFNNLKERVFRLSWAWTFACKNSEGPGASLDHHADQCDTHLERMPASCTHRMVQP